MKRTKVIVCMGLVGICAMQSIGQTSNGETVNTKKGVETTVSQAYFKMGDMRLINNDWGSKSLNCTTPYRVFIENDGTLGWEFTRGQCGGTNAAPDYPEIEFGIHPFGVAKDLVTSPDFSSTTLLPIQIKDVSSASVKIDQMNVSLQNANSWNMNFEMWLTDQHPVNGSHACAVAEIMVFWGWHVGRWPCDQEGSLTAGTDSYAFCHDAGGWGCGWRYLQYRVDGGSKNNYSGTLDVKAVLEWLVNQKGLSRDLWISRFEIGTEIGDNTSGRVTIRNLTFEVNGVAKSPEFYDPTEIGRKSHDPIVRKSGVATAPAGTTFEIVNLQGIRQSGRTGIRQGGAVELVKRLPRGVYLMYRRDGKDIGSKRGVVVPVM